MSRKKTNKIEAETGEVVQTNSPFKIVKGGIAQPLGRNLYLLKGKKHEQGGIDIDLKGDTRIFSDQPILNGVSPAEIVKMGGSPNIAFNRQERFKDVNGINDDGSKKAKIGKEVKENNMSNNKKQLGVSTGLIRVQANGKDRLMFVPFTGEELKIARNKAKYGTNTDDEYDEVLLPNVEIYGKNMSTKPRLNYSVQNKINMEGVPMYIPNNRNVGASINAVSNSTNNDGSRNKMNYNFGQGIAKVASTVAGSISSLFQKNEAKEAERNLKRKQKAEDKTKRINERNERIEARKSEKAAKEENRRQIKEIRQNEKFQQRKIRAEEAVARKSEKIAAREENRVAREIARNERMARRLEEKAYNKAEKDANKAVRLEQKQIRENERNDNRAIRENERMQRKEERVNERNLRQEERNNLREENRMNRLNAKNERMAKRLEQQEQRIEERAIRKENKAAERENNRIARENIRAEKAEERANIKNERIAERDANRLQRQEARDARMDKRLEEKADRIETRNTRIELRQNARKEKAEERAANKAQRVEERVANRENRMAEKDAKIQSRNASKLPNTDRLNKLDMASINVTPVSNEIDKSKIKNTPLYIPEEAKANANKKLQEQIAISNANQKRFWGKITDDMNKYLIGDQANEETIKKAHSIYDLEREAQAKRDAEKVITNYQNREYNNVVNSLKPQPVVKPKVDENVDIIDTTIEKEPFKYTPAATTPAATTPAATTPAATTQNQNGGFKNWATKNADIIGAGISGLASIAGSIISNRIANKTLKNSEYTARPISRIAAPLKTTININPQLNQVNENLAQYNKMVDENTASSAVALARKQQAANKATTDINNLYASKEHQETNLINQSRLNQQEVANANIDAYNKWSAGKSEFERNKNLAIAQNKADMWSDAATSIGNMSSSIQKGLANRNNMALLAASNPNVSPELLRSYGYKLRMGGKYKSNYNKKS